MAAQHARPGRSGKRARRERALERLKAKTLEFTTHYQEEGFAAIDDQEWYENRLHKMSHQARRLEHNLARPLRPIPPHQTRKLTR